MVKVYHAHPMVFWPMNDYRPTEGQRFQLVGRVATSDIHKVYELTQNLERSWTENALVVTWLGQCRSTSIGDVLETEDGRMWVVAPMGLEHITTPLTVVE